MKNIQSLASTNSTIDPLKDVDADHPKSLWRLALAFLKIGTLGFGGGMAVLPLVQRDCVLRHHCIEAEEFLHGVGLGQFLGPFVFNAAIFIGYRLFGVLGGLVAAIAFMIPSVLIVIVLSWLYFTFHKIPSLQGALAGLGPVVIALIVSTTWSIGRKSLHGRVAPAIAAASFGLSLFHVNAIWILAGAAVAGLSMNLSESPTCYEPPPPGRQPPRLMGMTIPVSLDALQWNHWANTLKPGGSAASQWKYAWLGGAIFSLIPLAWVFLKIGMVFFGGGFVLIPVLYHNLVLGLGWLTEKEFLQGVAISQLTPGPVAVLATFAGYKMAGVAGALVATIALFTPAAVLMFVISHFYKRLQNVRAVHNLLAGITPTVVGMVGAAAVSLAPASLHLAKPFGWGLCLISLLLLVKWEWHPALVLLIGVGSGLIVPGLL